MSTATQLGQAPIRTLFFRYYGPALVSLLSSTTHQVINGIILGRQVGRDGLAAVGLYGPVSIVFVALILPIMIGGGVLIGKSMGAGDETKTQQIFAFATTLVLLMGGMVALSAPLVARPLALFLAGPSDQALVSNTAAYLFWQLIGLPFFFLGMIWGNFIRAANAPTITRNASVLAAGVNIVLDLLLVVGLHKGVEGAAIATTIALAAGSAYLFVYLYKGNSQYSFAYFRFTLQLTDRWELVKIGAPSFASEVAFSAGLLLINQALVSYGSMAVSAFGLVNYLSFILLRLFTAAMIAAMPTMAFNMGAKRPHRVVEMLRFSLVFTVLLGLLIAGVGFLMPDLLISLFAGDQTAAYHRMASQAISLYFLLFLATGPNYVLAAYLQSIGKPTMAILINVLKGLVFPLACLWVMSDYGQLGLPGVWLSRSLAEVLTLLCVGFYTLYRWNTYYSIKALVPAP